MNNSQEIADTNGPDTRRLSAAAQSADFPRTGGTCVYKAPITLYFLLVVWRVIGDCKKEIGVTHL